MFKDSLNDPASVGMCREGIYLSMERVNDEFDVFGWYTFYSFLNHVVSVLVFDAFKDVAVEFFD